MIENVSKFGSIIMILLQMFVAITKLVLSTKKEQQKRAAEQPTDKIRLDRGNSKGKKPKGGKCC